MKKPLIAVVLFFIAGLPAAFAAKYGAVDLAKAYDGYWKTEDFKNKTSTRVLQLQQSFNAQKAALDEKVKKAQELEQTMKEPANSEAVKGQARQELQQLAQEIMGLERYLQGSAAQAQGTINQQMSDNRRLLMEEIRAAAALLAKQQGFDVVVDLSERGISMSYPVVYVAESMDLTEQLIAEINKSRPAKITPPPALPTPAAPAPAPAAPAPAPAPAAEGAPEIKFGK